MTSIVDWLDLATRLNRTEGEGSSISSSISAEANPLESVQKQLNMFEKSVVNDYQTQNVIPENDLKLPRFIIDSFSKTFLLWCKNPALKNSIQSDVFYDIFSSMFTSLNGETNDDGDNSAGDTSELTAVCEICDQQFTIINNDLKSSYAEHVQTFEHIETVNTFRMIGNSTQNCHADEVRNDSSDSKKQETRAFRPLNHKNNKWHARYIEKVSKNGVKYFCHLCKFTMNEIYIEEHIANRWHRYQVKLVDECYRVLEDNCCFVELIDESTFDFECHLCDIRNRGYTRLIEHCHSKIHIKFEGFYCHKFSQTIEENQSKPVGNFISSKGGGKWYCELCKRTVSTFQLAGHKKEAVHKTLENRASNVFKITKPYVQKINQRSSVCICKLCDVKFAAMNGIIQHCKTKGHIDLKNFAQEVRMSGSSISLEENQNKSEPSPGPSYQFKNKTVPKPLVVNKKDDFIIYDTRGVPYCELCNVNLSNTGNVVTHLTGKLHKYEAKKYY